MMKILVIQTTRMGDVLQTTPLIRALRRKHPNAHITVLIRDMGKAIMKMNPDVDEMHVYNEDSMFLNMRSGDSQRLLDAFNDAQVYISWIREQNFDIVYNCTNSISSAMLLKLSGCTNIVGAHMSDDWIFVLLGRWPNYFFTSVFHREYNDLNLCDISGRFEPSAEPCRELVLDVPDDASQSIEKLLEQHEVKSDDFVVCFQLGASEVGKRWDNSQFAVLGRMLKEKYNAIIFLVGVESESPLGESFEKHVPDLATHLFGKTNLPELAALLKRTNILVTNDTGTMHIAAAVECPIVLTSVGYVHFRETGPYAAGHCAVERRKVALGRTDLPAGIAGESMSIKPEQVMLAIELTLKNDPHKPFEQIEPNEKVESIDLYMTRFAPDGCLQWYPIVRRPMTEKDFIRIAYRLMWLDYLDAQTGKKSESESLKTLLKCYKKSDGTVYEWKDNLSKTFSEMAEMAHHGTKVTEELLNVLKKKERYARAKQIVAELVHIDEEIRIFGEINPACKPLTVITRFERDNLEGMDPMALAKATLKIYRDCFARAKMMIKKLKVITETSKSI